MPRRDGKRRECSSRRCDARHNGRLRHAQERQVSLAPTSSGAGRHQPGRGARSGFRGAGRARRARGGGTSTPRTGVTWNPCHECSSAGRPVGFRPRPILVRFGEDVRRVVQDGEARGPRRGVQGQGRPRVFARAGQKRQRGAVAATRGDAFGLVDTGTFVGSHQISKDSAPFSFDSLSTTTLRAFFSRRLATRAARLTVPRHTRALVIVPLIPPPRTKTTKGGLALEPRAERRAHVDAFAMDPKTRRDAGGAGAVARLGGERKEPRRRARVPGGASLLRQPRRRGGRRRGRARVRVLLGRRKPRFETRLGQR